MFSQMIIIKPGTGISSNSIISEDIFPVLHRLFIEHDKKFGITFPAYSFDEKGHLGNILEVLSEDREALASLHLEEHLSALSDYVKVKKEITTTSDYVLFKRIREEHRYETAARRMLKRGHAEPDRRLKMHVRKKNNQVFCQAYIKAKSSSTGQSYNIFLVPTNEKHGKFSAYGLLRGEGHA